MWMLMYAGIIGNEVHVFVYAGINILSKKNIIRRIPVCGNYGLNFMCKMYKLTVPDEYCACFAEGPGVKIIRPEKGGREKE